MSAKQGINQHTLLHRQWPNDCCLCNKEEEIERLKKYEDVYHKVSFRIVLQLEKENKRLRGAPLRLQADRLILEVDRLNKDLAQMNDLYDQTYKEVERLQGLLCRFCECRANCKQPCHCERDE